MSARRVVNVTALPRAMSHPEFNHGRHRPVVQFIMDWNDQPAMRSEMLCGGQPPIGSVPRDLALIAAVVHGLCDRDGITTPDWVSMHKLVAPVTMTGQPVDDDWGKWVVSQAPGVCADHGVYFEEEMLSAI